MKIVGFSILVVVLCAVLAPNFAFAKSFCKGNMFTRIDDGSFVLERVRFVPTPSFSEQLVVTSINGRPNFNFIKKSDEWTHYSYLDPQDALFLRRDPSLNFNYSNMALDKQSASRFREQAIVGFNIICRM